jgi:hypothetical protein
MMTDPPRRRLPKWVSTLVVVSVAAVFLVPGAGQPVERVGSTVLAPIQMGLSETMSEGAEFVDTIGRVRILASENADYRDRSTSSSPSWCACTSSKSKPDCAIARHEGPHRLSALIGLGHRARRYPYVRRSRSIVAALMVCARTRS